MSGSSAKLTRREAGPDTPQVLVVEPAVDVVYESNRALTRSFAKVMVAKCEHPIKAPVGFLVNCKAKLKKVCEYCSNVTYLDEIAITRSGFNSGWINSARLSAKCDSAIYDTVLSDRQAGAGIFYAVAGRVSSSSKCLDAGSTR